MEQYFQPTQEQMAIAEEFIDSLFEVDNYSALNLLQNEVSKINVNSPNEFEAFMLMILDSFWNFFQSQIAIAEKADFTTGFQMMQKAENGFETLRLHDLKELTSGLQLYYSAVVDIKALNLSAGEEKIKIAKNKINQVDKYRQNFSLLIDSLEAESYFFSGVNLMAQLEIEKGQVSFQKASSAIKKLATRHHEKDTPEYDYCIGLSYLYASFIGFFTQTTNLTNFDFEYFDYAENEAIEDSIKAIEYLSRVIDVNELARINLNISKGINLISQVICKIGVYMHNLSKQNIENVDFEFTSSKKMTKNARKIFIETGESGLAFLRYCKLVENQLKNTEKITKRRKIKVSESPYENDLFSKAQIYIQNGKNEKAIDLLISNAIDYDLFNDLILLKSRYSRLKKEVISGVLTNEEMRVEENKFSKSLLNIIELLKTEVD